MIGVGVSLRHLRGSVSSAALSAYAVLGLEPPLVLDFDENYFRTGGTATDLVSAANHTRAGNATMVDSDGVLKWAPHNLLTYSEQFDHLTWLRSNLSLASSDIMDPDGANNAVLLSPTSSPAYIDKTYVAAGSHDQVLYVKAAGKSVIWYRIADYSGNDDLQDYIDLTDGSSDTGGIVTVSTLENGWFRLKITAPLSDGQSKFSLWVVDAKGSTSVTPNGADGVLVWGAHAYRSDLGGMVNNPATGDSYVPTTDSARYLPRAGHHIWNGSAWVDEGYLHESEARTNLEDYSDMSSGTTLVNYPTLTPNNAVGPAGANTAATLTTNNATSQQGFATVQASSGSTSHTFSIFAKANGVNYIQLLASSVVFGLDVWGNFDLATGVAGTMGTAVLNHGIEDWGDGWYRVFITGLANGLSGGGGPYMVNAATTGRAGVVTGDGTSGLLLFGYQFEAGSTPSSYIPTSGSTVTRAADALTVPAANLPWPEPVVIGPELVTNGTFDTDLTGWADNSLGDGTFVFSSRRALIAGTDASNRGIFSQSIEPFLSVGKSYKISFDVVSGTCQAGLGPGIGNGGTFLTSSLPTGKIFGLFTYDGGSEILWFRTNFNGSTCTIDNISVREINPLAVSIQMEGTMTYADSGTSGSVSGGSGDAVFYYWHINSGNYIESFLATNNAQDLIAFAQESSGVRDGVGLFFGPTPGINVPFSIASRHGSTFINGAVDGTALTADLTPTTLPYLENTDMQIGSTFNGTIKLFRMWADDLTDEGTEEASSNA